MEDFERNLEKAGWDSRELRAGTMRRKRPIVERLRRIKKRTAKTKMKKIVENEQK